ncbi:MAG: 50S ribosomal protein L29 [Bacillota bacterium]|nr:50S ribosomal protein L29 [Syntrophomonadaceae bacterium]
MKAKKLRELTDEELNRKVADYKEELFNLRFQLATGQLDNPMRIRDVRKNIARCKTVLRQREIGIESNVR